MTTSTTTDTSDSSDLQQPSVFSRAAIARQQASIQRVQNVLLVWLDSNIDNSYDDCRNTITQLRRVMNEINTFTDADRCVQFIETTDDNKVCMIISGALGQHIVPRVHGMSQVDSIFIFCGHQKRHEAWAKDWIKIKGVYTHIDPICEALKHASRQCEQDAMSISFISTNGDASSKTLNQVDLWFVYTEILKKILSTTAFEPKHFKLFIEYCRVKFAENNKELENIKKLERTYQEKSPIWWYTCECFLYPMLNLGLRTMDSNIIIKMGFFINDLHRQIQQLHSEQFGSHHSGETFTMYRGQGLTKDSFEQMKNTRGGLISFNNFLRTSKKRDVSLQLARRALLSPDSVGVVFVMTIDPTQSTTPFASINDVSCFGNDEDGILFSMRSVFRIGNIQPLGENARLFQVNLTLTSENDQDLCGLTELIETETTSGGKGWCRLGSLLLKMDQPKKAEQVFLILLEQCDDATERGHICHDIGEVKYDHRDYKEAIELYEKAVEIKTNIRAPIQRSLAASYNNIGFGYYNMGDYPQALSAHEKAIAIQQKSLSPNHPDLAMSYNNIGLTYHSMNDYLKALSYYEKALAIHQRSLPPNHPDLAASYTSIGNVHDDIGGYRKALSYYEKTLAIQQKSLPSDHPFLAISYNNIGLVHESMGAYSEALSYYEKALDIQQESSPPNHPDVGACYSNIGNVYKNMGDNRNAQSNYERAVTIGEHSLPANHPCREKWEKHLSEIKRNL